MSTIPQQPFNTSSSLSMGLASASAELDIQALSQLLKACGDPLRVQILQVLKFDTFGVLELTQLFETKQSGMSHHLKVLSKVGLVEAQREGNAIFYRRPFHEGEVDSQTLAQVFTLLDRYPLPADLVSRIGLINEQRAIQSKAFFEKNAERFKEQQELICDLEQYSDASFELLHKANIPAGAKVLELGPGEGHFLKALSLNYAGVIALDTSASMLDKARSFAKANSLGNIEFIEGDTRAYIERQANGTEQQVKGEISAVVMNMVLHHVPTPAKIFEDCYELLAAKGAMVVCDLARHDQDWAKQSCGDLWLGFEVAELTRWANEAGFTLDESVYIGLRNGFQVQVHRFCKAH